jgi:SRSO17 transposase
MYLSGLLAEGERKSVQPMAQRLAVGDGQAMQQFVTDSPWPFEPMQERLGELLVERFSLRGGVLILDDTAFPKKGSHSVGVAPQYCGALGKTANCQVLVSWHYANEKLHFPLRGELYLPEGWTGNPKRLRRAGVPGRRHRFAEKWRLALDLLDTIRAKVPHDLVLMDAGYGPCRAFLRALEERGESYIAQIPSSMSFWSLRVPLRRKSARRGRPRRFPIVAHPRHKPWQAGHWAKALERTPQLWQRVVLPLKTPTLVEVAALRVADVDRRYWRRPGAQKWLLIERRGEEFKYYLSNLPETAEVSWMIALAHRRWTVEQGYQQLKEELGLDHYEGRSWQGFHHHVTLCFLAYAFLLLLQHKKRKKGARLFPRSQARAASSTNSFGSTAAPVAKGPAPKSLLPSGIPRRNI